MTSLRELRPHQQTALDGLKHSIMAGHRRPMLQAPTGAGKTVIAAHIVAGALAKGKRVAFCVPSIGLIDQTFERFVENGIEPADMGVIQADHPWRRSHAPVQICSRDTLARRDLPECDVVVIDEAHGRSKIYDKWMSACPDKIFIGLSATPWARGLGKSFDDLIKPTSLRELIAGGYLSPFRAFAPAHPDLSNVKTMAGDYHEGDLADAMNKPQLVADIVETWLAKGEDRSTLCFATSRDHARAIHDQFAEVGIPVAYVDANTPREERSEIGRQLEAGAIKVVCNIGTLTTGIDWDVRCIILARPTKSEMLFVQMIGRGLRTAPGKADCVILDHSDTHLRLGLVTDIDHDDLDDGSAAAAEKRKRKAKELGTPLPRECKGCSGLVPPLVKQCPCCGAEMAYRVMVETAEGELAEIGGRARGKAPSALLHLQAMGNTSIMGQIFGMMLERERSRGWAAHTYKDIFGVWPRGLDRTVPIDPTPALRSFIRHKNIKWAKSLKGGNNATL